MCVSMCLCGACCAVPFVSMLCCAVRVSICLCCACVQSGGGLLGLGYGDSGREDVARSDLDKERKEKKGTAA